jgi:myo-inositol-1(or 4)-monophosphatase
VTAADRRGYLAFAADLARDAGKLMRHHFRASPTREWKQDHTPVTAADLEINRLVIDRIARTYPGHGIWGEEESANLGAELTWVCDPVDGTMPFSHGLPLSTFSLALTEGGRPVVGVVYDPFLDRMFSAEYGHGSFLNGERLSVSDTGGLMHALVDLEGVFERESGCVLGLDPSFLRALEATGARIATFWSAGLSAALIAAGQVAATLYAWPSPEDAAAVKVIVEEAGGLLTDPLGREQLYNRPTNGFLASCSRTVHEQLLDLIADHRTSSAEEHPRGSRS